MKSTIMDSRGILILQLPKFVVSVARKISLVAVILSSFTGLSVASAAGITLIHAGTLLSEPGLEPKKNVSILIKDGRVTSVHDGFLSVESINAGAEKVDLVNLQDSFVMPGFIDLHVHLSSDLTSERTLRITQPDSYISLVAQRNAERTLMAGFTTIRDLGSRGTSIFSLRDAIKAGLVNGPNIVVSGPPITPTGGHGDFHGYRQEILDAMPSPGVCDGTADCRRAVRGLVKRGVDVIKVTVTGGVLSQTSTGTGLQFTQEELEAIVETAHGLGRKVTGHVHSNEGIIAAINAGFDSLEHAMWADEETLRLAKKKGVWIVPTVYPITYVGDTPEKMMAGPLKHLPPVIMAKLLELGNQPKIMTRLAHKVGVGIALGTDSGISPHGDNANEFIEYTNAGLSNMESLMTGTVNAAAAGGLTDRGMLRKGYAADIVAMATNPLDDITAVLNVTFVMRDGIIFKELK
jgi:imidazolonepropionase-like amidohydrolase